MGCGDPLTIARCDAALGFAATACELADRARMAALREIDNLFSRRYQNFGILGSNYFRGPGSTFDAGLAGPEPFRSPAAPFGAWLGIQYRLDHKGASG